MIDWIIENEMCRYDSMDLAQFLLIEYDLSVFWGLFYGEVQFV